MFESKYGKVLTVCLVIAILAIIGLVGFFIYDKIHADNLKKNAETGIEEFDRIVGTESPKPDDNSNDGNSGNNGDNNTEIQDIVPSTEAPSNNSGTSTSSNSSSRPTYGGFRMLGYIEIPKNNVRVPIVEKVTKKSLEVAVGTLYPIDAKLNEPGNVVIAGHNYRNSLFFSKNKNLQEGDKIYIKDDTGRKLTYVVYKNFEASDTDASFYSRDTGGVPEITLTTCVQTDSKKRTIILARAQ